jgi:DNA repair protein RadB
VKSKNVLSSGSVVFDELLAGGYERNVLTTIYGPAGSGKTNASLLAIAGVLRSGGRVLYIDTEGSFSVDRMQQLLPTFDAMSPQILFLRPYTFDEQKQAILKIRETIERAPKEFSLVVIDSIAMLYRLEVGKTLDVAFVNRELGIQLGILTELAGRYEIPVLITNQVYADFERKDLVKMVGGDLLKYSSKCLIELKKAAGGIRVALLVKHRSLPEGREVAYRIIQTGVEHASVPTLADRLKDDDDELL